MRWQDLAGWRELCGQGWWSTCSQQGWLQLPQPDPCAAAPILQGMKQAHTVFPRQGVSLKYLKAAERNHQKIKKMEYSYQDTTMALCTEDADLLGGYDKTDFKK